MKLLLLTTVLLASIANAGAQFVHPGMLHSKKDLEFLAAKLKKREQPWAGLWENLLASPFAAAEWQPQPIKVIVVGFYSKPDIGATAFTKDGSAAYTLALEYYVTKNKLYAEKVIDILRAWSLTLDSITDGNKKLLLGMNGIKYLNAAEIIRYSYNDWKPADQQAFEKMVLSNWYPLLQDFMPSYNGNWDAAIAQTMMCIGIFCNRNDIFKQAYNQCLKGASNGAINNYFNEWGQCQESGRDQGHVQMGLGFLTTVCELAWKQGYDLYGAYDNRLATGYEYTAKYQVGEEVKYVKYTTFENKLVFTDSISSSGRGKFSPIYERAYHHYHDRKGMEMPYSFRALQKSRNEEANGNTVPWASLMSIGYPVK